MWLRKVEFNQVKCIEQLSIDLGTDEERYKWVTLLGDNGTGKTTILQGLALSLSGRNPIGFWEFEEALELGNIEHEHLKTQIFFDPVDKPNTTTPIISRLMHFPQNRLFKIILPEYEPLNFEYYGSEFMMPGESILPEQPNGWFAAGYGAFRHISKKSAIPVVQILHPKKRNNFLTLFKEVEALGGFHQWLVNLSKKKEKLTLTEEKHYNLAIEKLDSLLPEGTGFHSVDEEGIWYNINGNKISASHLSDGFRSIIALVGDLIWRLMHTYSNSENPLLETGVVLIDELDIHLHPKWQRQIAGDLQRTFPNLQFIVTTHSPLVAAGAGKEAVTYQLELDEEGKTQIEEIKNIYAWSVNKILQSEAFDLESVFSIEIAAKIKEYYQLLGLSKRTEEEEVELNEIRPIIREALGEEANELSSMEKKLDDYIAKHWK